MSTASSSASKSRAKKAKPKQRTAKTKPSAFVYVLGSFHKGRYISYVGWTNDEWWADNGAAVEERFSRWLLAR